MSQSAHSTLATKVPLWLALIMTLALVIGVREGCLLICEQLNIASAANIVGLVVMFVLLMVWRLTVGLPAWITQASNTLLVDSGFAFLPVSAGAGLLLFALGEEFWGIVITIVVSTLLPMWGLAMLANRWLAGSTTDHANNVDITNNADNAHHTNTHQDEVQ